MINVEEVKQYNAELKKHKERANMLTAQKELYEKELTAKCAELSDELGITVTPQNIRQVYAEYEEKVKQTLSTGMAVLSKIAQSGEAERRKQEEIQQANQNIPGMQHAQNNQQMTGQTWQAAPQAAPQVTQQPNVADTVGGFLGAATANGNTGFII